MIFDCITYNGEKKMLKMRLKLLSPYVDRFVVVEFDKTFSGKEKSQRYDPESFKEHSEKIDYYFVKEEVYEKYRKLAERSPNTKGAEHWKTEFMQKESIKDCLKGLHKKDIVFVGDIDEIWHPRALDIDLGQKLKFRVYSYWLNNRSDEEFWGGLFLYYESIRDGCLNHLRTTKAKTDQYHGWHFTNMGGYEEVRRKLSDSYTRESYWTEEVENGLRTSMEQSRDFLGRGFRMGLDHSDLPLGILEDRQYYKSVGLWK